jgi:hypothetical protein
MLRFKTSPYIANGDIDPGTVSIAEQFAEIMVRISLDYDLEPDVWAAAQEVFQALKARKKRWPQQMEAPSRVYT